METWYANKHVEITISTCKKYIYICRGPMGERTLQIVGYAPTKWKALLKEVKQLEEA